MPSPIPGNCCETWASRPPRSAPPEAALRQFSLRVPRGFAARMHKGDARDPLLRQVLPVGAETDAVPGYGTDPVGDLTAEVVPGVLHKYHGRALLVLTGACAIHCRYCFRRHFPMVVRPPLGIVSSRRSATSATIPRSPR